MEHTVDETAGWIFTDEGHQWIDEVRGGWDTVPGERNYQIAYDPMTGGLRPGWEYGLFGFKEDHAADEVFEGAPKTYHFDPEDMSHGKVLL